MVTIRSCVALYRILCPGRTTLHPKLQATFLLNYIPGALSAEVSMTFSISDYRWCVKGGCSYRRDLERLFPWGVRRMLPQKKGLNLESRRCSLEHQKECSQPRQTALGCLIGSGRKPLISFHWNPIGVFLTFCLRLLVMRRSDTK